MPQSFGVVADSASLAVAAGKQVGRLAVWSNDRLSFTSLEAVKAGVKAEQVLPLENAHAAGAVTGTAWLSCPKNGAPGKLATVALDGELKYWRVQQQKVRHVCCSSPADV